MRKILKYFRKNRFVNKLVRKTASRFIRFSDKTKNAFHKHWMVSGIIELKLPEGENIELESRADDYISTQIYWKGFAGYEDSSALLFYYLAKKSSCIFDVGANIGYFSIIAAKANPKAQVIAFEPIPEIVIRLEENRKRNALDNIRIETLMVGDSNEETKIYIPADSHSIPLSASAKKDWNSNIKEMDVTATSLDNYRKTKNTGKIDLVKIDCELTEDVVLQGMNEILKTDKPVLLIEILFPESDEVGNSSNFSNYALIEKILKENNYFFYLINNTALIKVDHLIFNPDSRNYLCSTLVNEKRFLPYSNMPDLVKQIC